MTTMFRSGVGRHRIRDGWLIRCPGRRVFVEKNLLRSLHWPSTFGRKVKHSEKFGFVGYEYSKLERSSYYNSSSIPPLLHASIWWLKNQPTISPSADNTLTCVIIPTVDCIINSPLISRINPSDVRCRVWGTST